MTETELKTPSFWGIFSLESIYLLAFAWLFGQSIWQSFFGGVIAHKALTRQTFSVLQARLFPTYFCISTILSSVLLAMWTRANQDAILGSYVPFSNTSVSQAYVLLTVLLLSLVNWFYIGPTTNEIIVTRQRLERVEGKPYYDPGISQKMKDINWQFTIWHGISALANLFVIVALAYHGMWFANFGLQNKQMYKV